MSYYNVVMDGLDIYNPSYREMSFISAEVVTAAGQAGSFEILLPNNHIFVNSFIPYGSTVEVFEDGESIFYGRPLPPSIDLWGQKKIHCEGALAFLNDVICPTGAPGLANEMNDGQYYRFLINYYNSHQARADRRLIMGTVPSGGVSHIREWSYRSCFDELRSNVLPYTGGIILTRRVNGNTYIDWVEKFSTSGNQPIKIGLNLIDATRTERAFYTMAIAKGGQDSEGNPVYMTSPVKLSADICGKYGNICAYLDYPAVTSVSLLQTKCREFLNKQQFNSFSFEAEAIDLHIANSGYDRLDVGQNVMISFADLGEDVCMPITKVIVDMMTGKKMVTVSAEDWTEKQQYVKNDIAMKPLSEVQSDLSGITQDMVSDFDIGGVEPIDWSTTETDITDTDGNVWDIGVVVNDDGSISLELTEEPTDVEVREKIVEEDEIDEYERQTGDTGYVEHPDGTIEELDPEDEWNFSIGDKVTIIDENGNKITWTVTDDSSMDIGDSISSDDVDDLSEKLYTYVVGSTLGGPFTVIPAGGGEEYEIDTYTYQATDQVTIVHDNNVIDIYMPGDPFTWYYGDSISIECANGDTIYCRTSVDDAPEKEAGDIFDEDEYDVFLEYGDGTEEKMDPDDWHADLESGYEFKGDETDPSTINFTADKITTKKATITVPDSGSGGSISGSVGETDINTSDIGLSLTDSIGIGVSGSDVYIVGISFTQAREEYNVGEELLYSDFTVVVNYSDGSTEDITSDCIFNIEDGYTFMSNDTHHYLVAMYKVNDETFAASTRLVVEDSGATYTVTFNSMGYSIGVSGCPRDTKACYYFYCSDRPEILGYWPNVVFFSETPFDPKVVAFSGPDGNQGISVSGSFVLDEKTIYCVNNDISGKFNTNVYGWPVNTGFDSIGALYRFSQPPDGIVPDVQSSEVSGGYGSGSGSGYSDNSGGSESGGGGHF